jgi:hypothetical protein
VDVRRHDTTLSERTGSAVIDGSASEFRPRVIVTGISRTKSNDRRVRIDDYYAPISRWMELWSFYLWMDKH